MTISNDSTILASDRNTAFDATITTLQTANRALPMVQQQNFVFRNVISSTSAQLRRAAFVMPDDLFINEVDFSVYGTSGATYTLTVSSTNMIEDVEMSLTATGTGNLVQAPRYYVDADNPLQVLLKGSTVTVLVASTSSTANCRIHVGLSMYCPARRY